MTEKKVRNYNCRDEELPIIASMLYASLSNDLEAFTSFSPLFNVEYLSGIQTQISHADQLVKPKDETVLIKVITGKIQALLDNLMDTNNRMEGYILLAGKSITIAPEDFNIVGLRKAIVSDDAESAIACINTIVKFITMFQTELEAVGCTQEIATTYTTAQTAIKELRVQQYNLTASRKSLTQSNVKNLNELYAKMQEVMQIGKILFRNDAAKLNEYTFMTILSKVRRIRKSEGEVEENTEENSSEN